MPGAVSPLEAIARLEDAGYITPRCPDCAHVYHDAVHVAAMMTADPLWRPSSSHTPALFCETGREHCNCAPCLDRALAPAVEA